MPGRPGANPRDLHNESDGPTSHPDIRASELQQLHEDIDARAKRRRVEARVDGDSRAVDASCASVDKDRLRQRSMLADQSASCGGPIQALGVRPTTDNSPILRVRGLPNTRAAGAKQATADDTVVISDDEDQMEESAVGSDGDVQIISTEEFSRSNRLSSAGGTSGRGRGHGLRLAARKRRLATTASEPRGPSQAGSTPVALAPKVVVFLGKEFRHPITVKSLNLGKCAQLSLSDPLAPLSGLAHFRSLRVLDLSHNQLKALPMAMWTLVGLEQLNFSNNLLPHVPDEIGCLVQLTQLNLSGNLIEVLPAEIGTLSKLWMLHVGHNLLRVLPKQLRLLGALRHLVLDHNKLRTLPDALGKLSGLRTLNLSHNPLVSPPSTVLGQLDQLRRLHLSANGLMSLPVRIGRLSLLQELHLEHNRFTVVPEAIWQLQALVYLNLAHNKLTELPRGIASLTRLQQLHLGDNLLDSLPAQVQRLTKLTVLDVSHNALVRLPSSIGELTLLRRLNLSFNRLGLSGLFGPIEKLKHLTELNLLGNLYGNIQNWPAAISHVVVRNTVVNTSTVVAPGHSGGIARPLKPSVGCYAGSTAAPPASQTEAAPRLRPPRQRSSVRSGRASEAAVPTLSPGGVRNVWKAVTDARGRGYFWNVETDAVRWEFPVRAPPAGAPDNRNERPTPCDTNRCPDKPTSHLSATTFERHSQLSGWTCLACGATWRKRKKCQNHQLASGHVGITETKKPKKFKSPKTKKKKEKPKKKGRKKKKSKKTCAPKSTKRVQMEATMFWRTASGPTRPLVHPVNSW